MKIFQEAMGAARDFFLISSIPKRFEKLENLEFLGNLEELEDLEKSRNRKIGDLGDPGNLEELGAMAFRICFAALR